MAMTIECSGKDMCVLCWTETDYVKDMPIEKRACYVEGGGQLCPACYINIYGRPHGIS